MYTPDQFLIPLITILVFLSTCLIHMPGVCEKEREEEERLDVLKVVTRNEATFFMIPALRLEKVI